MRRAPASLHLLVSTDKGVTHALGLPDLRPCSQPAGYLAAVVPWQRICSQQGLGVCAIVPLKHVSVELDRSATRNAHAVYPDAHPVRDKGEADAKLLECLFEAVQARFISVVGARPCQDARGLYSNDAGVTDDRNVYKAPGAISTVAVGVAATSHHASTRARRLNTSRHLFVSLKRRELAA